MEQGIDIYNYDGEGLERSYACENRLVGIKNYKPASSREQMDSLEKHLLTDELFIPLTEGSILLYKQDGGSLCHASMEMGRIYSVRKGTWHNVLMIPGGKMALTERADTSTENSLLLPLTREERGLIQSL